MGCMFAGWVPNAEYSGDVKDVREDCEAYNATLVGNHCDQLKDVESAQAATAVGHTLSQIYYNSSLPYTVLDFWSTWHACRSPVSSIHEFIYFEKMELLCFDWSFHIVWKCTTTGRKYTT